MWWGQSIPSPSCGALSGSLNLSVPQLSDLIWKMGMEGRAGGPREMKCLGETKWGLEPGSCLTLGWLFKPVYCSEALESGLERKGREAW